jgi:hypothetical protein
MEQPELTVPTWANAAMWRWLPVAHDEGNGGEAPIAGHRMDAPRREAPATGLAGTVLLPPHASDPEVGMDSGRGGSRPGSPRAWTTARCARNPLTFSLRDH